VAKQAFAVGVTVINTPGQCLVAAVFAPCLGNRLELNVRRIALELAKMLLNGSHFGQRQIELSLATQLQERIVVERAQRDRNQIEFIRRSEFQALNLQWPPDQLLDRVVGQ